MKEYFLRMYQGACELSLLRDERIPKENYHINERTPRKERTAQTFRKTYSRVKHIGVVSHDNIARVNDIFNRLMKRSPILILQGCPVLVG